MRFRSSFIDDYTTRGKDYAISRLHLAHLTPDLTAIIQSIYKTAGVMGAKIAYSEIKKAVAQKGDGSFGKNATWIAKIQEFLKLHLLKFVVRITETMRQDITNTLDKAVENGWSIDRTVEELKRSDLIEARARTIARTEIIRAANVGHSVAAKSLPYEVDKKWIAANDHRTRHSHRDINGHTTGEDDTFKVEIFEGKNFVGYDEMLFPGDPNAHPANTINCRCRVIYVPKKDSNGKPILRSSTTATIIPMQGRVTHSPIHQIAAALKANIFIGVKPEGETE